MKDRIKDLEAESRTLRQSRDHWRKLTLEAIAKLEEAIDRMEAAGG